MRSTFVKAVLTATLALAAYDPCQAGTLQVEPVIVDVTAPGGASTVTLRNEGAAPIEAQIRVFRWSLVDGQEKLEPTDDVVASPPSATLTPKGLYIVRVVRVSKKPMVGEESYRLLVDQLPDEERARHLVENGMPTVANVLTSENLTGDSMYGRTIKYQVALPGGAA